MLGNPLTKSKSLPFICIPSVSLLIIYFPTFASRYQTWNSKVRRHKKCEFSPSQLDCHISFLNGISVLSVSFMSTKLSLKKTHNRVIRISYSQKIILSWLLVDRFTWCSMPFLKLRSTICNCMMCPSETMISVFGSTIRWVLFLQIAVGWILSVHKYFWVARCHLWYLSPRGGSHQRYLVKTSILYLWHMFVLRYLDGKLLQWQGVKHYYFSYFFLFFSLNSFFSYFLLFFSLNSYFSYFFSDFKVKSGYGYISQLYVRGMASLHLIYHPVEAEYKSQMSLEGSYWGEGVGKFPSAFWICFPMQSVQGKCDPEALFWPILTVLIKCKHFSWPGLLALQL